MHTSWRDNLANISPLLKLFLDIIVMIITFFIFVFVLMFFFNLMGSSSYTEALNFSKDNQTQYKIIQGLYSLSLFAIPAIFIAFLFSSKPFSYLLLNQKTKISNFVVVLLLFIFSIPLINLLALFNNQLSFPSVFGEIETIMKEMEQKAMQLTDNLLKVSSFEQFAINVIVIALIPAIGEEFLFRGIFQKHLTELTKNVHWAIIVTNVIFSAIHFQFFTFLPRFFLGVVLGYIFYLSGNLWLSIFGHFVNNFFAVFVYFWASLNNIDIDKTAKEIGTTKSQYIFVIISVVLVAFLLYLLKYNCKSKEN